MFYLLRHIEHGFGSWTPLFTFISFKQLLFLISWILLLFAPLAGWHVTDFAAFFDKEHENQKKIALSETKTNGSKEK